MMTTKSKASSSNQTTTEQQTQSGYVGEGEYLIQTGILNGQIRSERLRGLKEKKRGETAKADRAKFWADKQEVKRDIEEEKLGIEQDNLKGVKVERVINQTEIVSTLSKRAYKVELTQVSNGGLRQVLLNEGKQPKMDHLGNLNSIAVETEAAAVKKGK